MPNIGIAEIFDKTTSLSEDTYTQYSDQFLSEEEKIKVSEAISDDLNVITRAEILCISGKDPFSPPINSLSVSGRSIDPHKVRKCFKQGYNVYKFIIEQKRESLEPARLYKLGLFNTSTDYDVKQFADLWSKIIPLKSKEEFDLLLKEVTNNNVKKALMEYRDNILIAFSKKSPDAKQKALKTLFPQIKKNIKDQGSLTLFKSTKNYQDLKRCGAVYNIGDDAHSWGTNLSWTLAHLRQGNNFIICSDNILNNQYRGHYRDTPCAFAREICVVLKAGYTLSVSLSGMTLTPEKLSNEYLKQLDSTGELGNGVNPTFDEINSIFADLNSNFQNAQQFTYRYQALQAIATNSMYRLGKPTSPELKEQLAGQDQDEETASAFKNFVNTTSGKRQKLR